MTKKRIHLVCNAHLAPVWLWHWEDGLTEAKLPPCPDPDARAWQSPWC